MTRAIMCAFVVLMSAATAGQPSANLQLKYLGTAGWEISDGRTTILFFEANVGDRDLQGIDILEENENGFIERFTVMIRPLSGLQAVAATMAERLAAS